MVKCLDIRDLRISTATHLTENTQVYQLYLQGRYFLNKKTSEGFSKVIEFFDQAIAQDARYAPAYVDLALCWI